MWFNRKSLKSLTYKCIWDKSFSKCYVNCEEEMGTINILKRDENDNNLNRMMD